MTRALVYQYEPRVTYLKEHPEGPEALAGYDINGSIGTWDWYCDCTKEAPEYLLTEQEAIRTLMDHFASDHVQIDPAIEVKTNRNPVPESIQEIDQSAIENEVPDPNPPAPKIPSGKE